MATFATIEYLCVDRNPKMTHLSQCPEHTDLLVAVVVFAFVALGWDWFGFLRFGLDWCGVFRFGLVRFGLFWFRCNSFGLVWVGLAWHGAVCFV